MKTELTMAARSGSECSFEAGGTLRRTSIQLRLLAAATVFATYQLYFLPLAGTFFPLAIFFAWMCIAFAKPRSEDVALVVLTVIYCAAIVCSGLWSSDLGAWANALVYGFTFFIAFFAARNVRDEQCFVRIVRIFVSAASLNAALVIAFRLLPDIEAMFLTSGLLNLFKNPKRVADLVVFRPNVFDPLKAGGVFDNANTGAAFSLVCLGALLSTFDRWRRVTGITLAALFVSAIIASGSKSAVLILVGVGGVCTLFALPSIADAYMRWATVFLGLGVMLVTVWASVLLNLDLGASDFAHQTAHTSSYRVVLLQIAEKAFLEHPLRGLGFGGWALFVQKYASVSGVEDYWPPHNGVVLAWTEGGLPAAMAVVCLASILIWRLMQSASVKGRSLRATGALFALLSTFVMSLGDTFQSLGSQNAAVPLGVVIAWGLFHDPLSGVRQRAEPSVT